MVCRVSIQTLDRLDEDISLVVVLRPSPDFTLENVYEDFVQVFQRAIVVDLIQSMSLQASENRSHFVIVESRCSVCMHIYHPYTQYVLNNHANGTGF